MAISLVILSIFGLVTCNAQCSPMEQVMQPVADLCACPPTTYWQYGYSASADLEYYSCASCLDCPVGQYKNCAAGMDILGNSVLGAFRVCQTCVVGTYCAAGSIAPGQCQAGFYCPTSASQIKCSLCPAGTLVFDVQMRLDF